jgi:hypothetical protein
MKTKEALKTNKNDTYLQERNNVTNLSLDATEMRRK